MKITAQDKEKLFSLLDKATGTMNTGAIEKHKAQVSEMRFRWDLLWASNIKIGDGIGVKSDIDLYAYMNDNHIDTALKAYVVSRNL
jgi:hypothetical protein